MSAVTDTKYHAGETFVSRNASSELFADEETIAARRRIHRSGDGEICYRCGKPYGLGQAVVYGSTWHPSCRGRRKITYCLPCAPTHRERWDYPCQVCERPVHFVCARRRRRHVFCSAFCERQHYAKQQRDKRIAARQKHCATCGNGFEATRSDGEYCSGRCRQRAYRQRVTDNESVQSQA